MQLDDFHALTVFEVTVTVFPPLPENDDLTDSMLDALSGSYCIGVQEYLRTLGLDSRVTVGAHRRDVYRHPEPV
jgi:hypothetical protein